VATVTCIEIRDEALAIARHKAAAAGLAVGEWLARAINTQAAQQEPVEEIPVDDCGFPSLYSRTA
jgi:hypothetical protein